MKSDCSSRPRSLNRGSCPRIKSNECSTPSVAFTSRSKDEIASCERLKRGEFDSLQNFAGIGRLHWQLDVAFQEDPSRLGHADANFRVLRRTAWSLLKNNHSKMPGIKTKRLAAA
jgi:hypothetical protein